MELTPVQQRALDAIGRWLLKPGAQPFILAGYAGTGKTTLLQEFINRQSAPVLCCAPTGKAASVLAQRLKNTRVSTIHAALYKPRTPSLERLDTLMGYLTAQPDNAELLAAVAAERAALAGKGVGFVMREGCSILPGQLVVVDEASMVTRGMMRDFASTNAKVLYVGDPGQLPPVMDEGFFRSNAPDVMLEDVMRQALDSAIIRISMDIREGQGIPLGSYGNGEVRKIRKEDMPSASWLEYDQVITGTNAARHQVNRFFRQRKYGDKRSWWPMEGDKLICLKNEQDNGVYYINGVMGTAISNTTWNDDFGFLCGDILYDGIVCKNLAIRKYPFHVHYDPSTPKDLPHEFEGLRQFDYAYAITVHKSQGSEFDRVIFADDGFWSDKPNLRKLWLYTAVTRAKKELVWLV